MPKLSITVEEMQDIILGNDYGRGFCRSCGEDQYGCEPDARNYLCESCGEREVFGAEELMMMGELEIE